MPDKILPSGSPLTRKKYTPAYYLDTCFNLGRRHSALGYRSPHQFERNSQINIS